MAYVQKRLMSSLTGLKGRVAVVTGAGSGIGRAVCKLLDKEEANVVAVDLNGESAKQTIGQLSSASRHLSFALNVTHKSDVDRTFKAVLEEFKKPATILVNCAGITKDSQLLDMTEENFDQVINVNLKGSFLTTQAAFKYMKEFKVDQGSIVNVSSVVGKVGNFGQTNYSSSKAGVVGLTKSTAKELAKHNIRCNAIMPGFIETPMIETVPEKMMTIMSLLIPLGRKGQAEEVAEAILFLASPKSSYVTGTVIEVTGGLFM
ncbi:(3R)-3-hydroxyacyl-CoA dehydrogenase [Halotydeus destructor]|nr:(3R)-3-hydroxyacyl-CoA dehydrogenase [Halotydeus destructor]